MLVRLAIMRYIVPGAETDISNAVGCLMKQLVERLVPAAKQDPNSFRRKYCYIESVCKVFDRLKRSRRMLFDLYADPPGVKTPEAHVLHFHDWMKMLKDLCSTFNSVTARSYLSSRACASSTRRASAESGSS